MFCLVTDLATSQDFSTARLGASPSSRAGAGFGKSLHGSKVLLIIFGFGSVFPSCTALPSGCLFSANTPGIHPITKTQPKIRPKSHLSPSLWRVFLIHSDSCWPRAWRETPSRGKKRWTEMSLEAAAWEAPLGVISKFSSTGRNLELLNRKCRWCRHKSLGKSFP